jgi:hypothetical protein
VLESYLTNNKSDCKSIDLQKKICGVEVEPRLYQHDAQTEHSCQISAKGQSCNTMFIRPSEVLLFQPLLPGAKTVSIPVEDFEKGSLPVAKAEQRSNPVKELRPSFPAANSQKPLIY